MSDISAENLVEFSTVRGSTHFFFFPLVSGYNDLDVDIGLDWTGLD